MNASIVAATHVGKVRQNNEDSYRIAHIKQSGSVICVVADGMGGHAAGEVASRIAAVRAIESLQRSIRSQPDDDLEPMVRHAFLSANSAIYGVMRKNENCSGMGTTMTLACLHNGKVIIGQVGDSRAYLLRGGVLQQLTQDHSMVQEMLCAGLITPEQAKIHPQRHIITRAMGTHESVETDCFTLDWQPKDRILLCTDGIHDVLTSAEIRAALSTGEDGQATVDALVANALASGGKDNITVVLMSYEPGEAGCGA